MKQTGIDIFIGYHGTDNKKSSYMAAQRICDIILNKSIKDGYDWEIFLYRYTDNTTKYEETHTIKSNVLHRINFYGSNDPFIPKKYFEEFADSIGAKSCIIENGGHLNSYSGFETFPKLLEEIMNCDK